MIVLGSYDTSVADRAAELFQKGYTPLIIFSGAFGKYTTGIFPKPEAEVLADIAIEKGVPPDKIIIENKSTNTGENILFSKKILEDKKLGIKSCIVVCKPYMERRAFATFKKNWPEIDLVVTSPQISFQEYLKTVGVPEEQVIGSIVSDTQRAKIYGENGLQIPQEIPDHVWKAWEGLVALGYLKNPVK